MAIAYESKVDHPFYGGSASPVLPEGLAEGDLLIAFLHSAGQVWTLPDGWTELHSSGDGYTVIAWRVAVAVEPEPTFSLASETYANVMLLRYSGADAVSPISASEAMSSGVDTSPSITTTSDGNQIVHWLASDGNMGATVTPPAGDVLRSQMTAGYDMYLLAWLADRSQVSAGATGVATWSPDPAITGQKSGTFAIVPAGGGGGGGGGGEGGGSDGPSGMSGMSGLSAMVVV